MLYQHFAGISKYASEEETVGGLAAFKNAGKPIKDGLLGTSSSPIHMVSAEGGNFKEQLWRTIRTIALAFLLISGVGALIEDKGISKGIFVLCNNFVCVCVFYFYFYVLFVFPGI